jgi:hypothetical protein
MPEDIHVLFLYLLSSNRVKKGTLLFDFLSYMGRCIKKVLKEVAVSVWAVFRWHGIGFNGSVLLSHY